ncbi:protein FAM200C-like [Rhinoderma darwinii]|uniref:protein FAM200C-like n=1 Tax=Rhinoderma darwinii TaxID=43563 RepID=UPI003F67F8CD
MSSKKRKWSDEYVQYGFTCITERDGSQRPNCMICNARLRNSSLAPAKLREHFLKLHGDGQYKNTTLAEFKVKRARFDEKATLPVLGFVPINKPILTASYEVAYLIAKQGKPHTIGETLIKPAVLKMANIMLGKAAEVKLSQIPLSNDTVSDRIEDMCKDILAQVVADLISSPAKFSLQLDETTDVSNLSQLAVFVRYVKDDVIKEDFLFCKPLTTTTKAADVKTLVDDFFKDNNLPWDMVSAVCSDGAPVMLGRKSGFGALVKADAPHIIVTHCILHRHALATKTLPPKLAEVLKIVVEYVNYVRNSALRHRIFSKLCKEMGSEFEVLLYHSNVRWLSRGQVLNRVFAVRVELALFLQEHQHRHADCLKNSEFILILAYIADIFAALNHLNQQMQGGGVNIIEAEENLKAFQKKLSLWKRRTENDNFANFPLLDDCVSKIEDVSGIGDISVPAELKQAIATHLDELAKSLDGYFPTRESYPAWVRQPFTFSVETTDVNDKYLDEIIEIQQSQVQQQLFRTTTLSTFWCQQMVTYPVIAKKALEIFIPFVTTYLCEQSFSRMLDIKTKKRNRLCCENDMRVALAKVKPRISELVSERVYWLPIGETECHVAFSRLLHHIRAAPFKESLVKGPTRSSPIRGKSASLNWNTTGACDIGSFSAFSSSHHIKFYHLSFSNAAQRLAGVATLYSRPVDKYIAFMVTSANKTVALSDFKPLHRPFYLSSNKLSFHLAKIQYLVLNCWYSCAAPNSSLHG